jgi:DNA-binding beta-propeller fold protein YncE
VPALAALLVAGCAPAVASRAASPQASPWPTGTIVVSNMDDTTATLVDAATGLVRATLRTGAGPHEVAATRDGRWAVVSNYGVRGAPGSSLTVIDIERAIVARTIGLGGYRRPHGLQFLAGDTLLAVTAEADQAVLLVDLRTDRVVRMLPTRGRGSHMVAIAASGAPLFTANVSDGTLSVLDPADTSRVRVIPVAAATEAIASTPAGDRVWLGSNGDSIVVVVDPSGGASPDTLRGFGMPYRIAISSDGATAVVTDPVRAEVRVFDARTRALRWRVAIPRDSLVATAEVPGSPSPEGVALSADGNWAFVTLQGRNRVVWLDLARGLLLRSAPTGRWSDGIAFAPSPRN